MEVKSSYATYQSMNQLSYRIVEKLLTDPKAEIIWKLLKYTDSNAYEEPNLTMEEKRKLIYTGQLKEADYRVFFDFQLDVAQYQECAILRIYPAEIYPTNRVTAICMINVEVFSHARINHLSNYTTRVDTIVQALIECLNGVDVGGVGVLFFDNQATNYNKISVIGQKPFKGKLIKMAVNIG